MAENRSQGFRGLRGLALAAAGVAVGFALWSFLFGNLGFFGYRHDRLEEMRRDEEALENRLRNKSIHLLNLQNLTGYGLFPENPDEMPPDDSLQVREDLEMANSLLDEPLPVETLDVRTMLHALMRTVLEQRKREQSLLGRAEAAEAGMEAVREESRRAREEHRAELARLHETHLEQIKALLRKDAKDQ